MNNPDNWQKLAEYPTDILTETHAGYLRNNGIHLSIQTLSELPGMNSGGIIWVAPEDYEQAKVLLGNIDENLDESFEDNH